MKSKFFNYSIFALLSLLLYVLERGEMFAGQLDDEPEFTILNYIIVAMLGLSGSVVLLNKNKWPRDNFSKCFVYTSIVIYILTILWSIIYVLPQRNVYGYSLLPLAMYLYMVAFVRNQGSNNLVILTSFIITILLSTYFFTNYYNNLSYEISQQYNASYTILFFLPFMLCVQNRILRLISIGIVTFAIMFSLKRGGFISMAIGIIIYLYISQVSIRGRKIKLQGWIILILMVLIAVLVIVNINTNYLDNMMFSRLEDMQDTGGSGRSDLYNSFLKKISNGDIVDCFFGHGWGGTMRTNFLHLTAHNDFIEVFYDFGIVGFSFYIMVIVNMIKVCRKFIKDKFEYAPAMGASIGIFLASSMVSHIWIYYKYLVIFAMFWGFVISSYYKNNLNKIVIAVH